MFFNVPAIRLDALSRMVEFARIIPDKDSKAAELVAKQIRKAIIGGALAANDTLPAEPQLIAAFGVSRPTIREAIRILEAEDLVSVMRGARGGSRIKAPSAAAVARTAGHTLQSQGATLRDIYDTRMVIEPPAARLAAETRPAEAAAALQAQVNYEYDIVGLDEWRKVGMAVADFHRVLLEQCGNPALGLVGLVMKGIVEHHQTLLSESRRGEDVKLRHQRVKIGFASHQRL
ncbi:MAG: transcriptional regulator, GntR family, partial [Brevundimonas sp.]|nr:transcriptional regulator, GntR family [Brevundimonas sp.]